MCLFKKSLIPRITLKPKTVYKIVSKSYNNGCCTYFMEDKVNLGKIYTGKFTKREIFSFLFERYIDSGFIHSYSENIDLESIIFEYIKLGAENLALIKCEIPRFTLYYNGHEDEIASRRLKYIEEIREL